MPALEQQIVGPRIVVPRVPMHGILLHFTASCLVTTSSWLAWLSREDVAGVPQPMETAQSSRMASNCRGYWLGSTLASITVRVRERNAAFRASAYSASVATVVAVAPKPSAIFT